MVNVAKLFLEFRDRIARQEWWLAMAILLGVETGYFWLTDPTYYDAPIASLPSTVANLVFIVPMTALIVKRCNDRDWPSWTGLLVQLPLLAFIIGDYHGYFADDENLTIFQVGIYGGFVAAMAFVLLDNGFLRGTVGANRYGPDPLAAAENV